ncbi:OmpA family protein [Petrachloros mirabilis]
MTTQRMQSVACLLVVVASSFSLQTAWADGLDSIRFGESARSFAAGSIQVNTPQDGVVNVITGDNQTIGNRMRLGQNDIFYIKLKKPGEVAVGDLYTIFKRTRKVFHPANGEYLGYLVNRLAVVQVVQVDKVLAAAKAVRAYGPVAPGDPIAKFSLPPAADASSSPVSGDLAGMVVDIQADLAMTLVAQRNIVYLDRGSEDGLRIGHRMDLVRYGGGLPPRKVGEVRVLSTEERTATAIITKSTSRILKGDRFQTSFDTADMVPLPVSLPAVQAPETLPPADTSVVPGSDSSQQASHETRYNLSDFMKQLRFESGEATIKPEGYQVLDQLVDRLKQDSPDLLIRIEGHADNMEIGPSLLSVYPTNWDLSKARASTVVRYLMEKGGIDSARMSSVGYADTKPIASNATEAGRQQNRRVEIVIYPPETTVAQPEEAVKPSTPVEDERQAKNVVQEDSNTSLPDLENSTPQKSEGMETPEAAPTETVPGSTSPTGKEIVPALQP